MAKPIVDVSEFNGILDWDEIKSQIDGAIIRCGYGGNVVSQDDPQYARNVKECTRLKIPFGVYLFSYAKNAAEAENEAEHVLRLVEGWNLSLPIYYDLEQNDVVGNLSAEGYSAVARSFCKRIEAAGGVVGIYSNLYLWETKLKSVNEYTRWLAQWSEAPTYDKPFLLWQYTSSGVIRGSSPRTDLSKWYGDFMTMCGTRNHFGKAPAPQPTLKYKIGDEVSFKALYRASDSKDAITNIAVTHGKITRIIANARNPYLINDGTGWVNDSVITAKGGETANLKVNDNVKVKPGAKDYNGVSLAPFVYQNTYQVQEVKGNRIVIGKDKKVTAAIAADYLIKV